MSGPNILLTRIDNRLVHGQVGVTWVNHLGANLLVVANDKVSEDEVQQNLMDMVLLIPFKRATSQYKKRLILFIKHHLDKRFS